MKIKFCVIAFFQVLVLGLLFIQNSFAKEHEISENIYKRISALQCDSLIKANETNPNFVVLDVRSPGEWENYHILGSINRSTGLTDFTAQLSALPKHKIFILHCQSGGRSAGAFAKMKEIGFAEVYEMIGGINSWNSSGLPTTKITKPKLMLVSDKEITRGDYADTVKVTVTNRANGVLNFGTVSFSDLHHIENNFNKEIAIEGAQDYTFSIVHSPGYSGDEATKISIESNGGKLDLNIEFENGTIVGIEEQQIVAFNVYPNPANQNLYFKLGGLSTFDEISVLNIAGQEVLRETEDSISNGLNISNLRNGIYFVRLKTDDQIISRKFIVKR
jgi:rhodanese-related sulfurtransferase